MLYHCFASFKQSLLDFSKLGADLGMFSMFGRTGHKSTNIFVSFFATW